jgi:hypothetical protein
MYGSERTSRSGSANLGGLTQALGAWPCLHSLPHTISEPLLTPRLMSLLDPAAPQAAEVGAVNASLESLQSTLGAAYMLLAAECKAETLEAQVSLARARLADHVTVGLGMYTGIIHGRHLSLFSLGWRAGRSGGSRLAVAITISHSKPKEATCGTVPLN